MGYLLTLQIILFLVFSKMVLAGQPRLSGLDDIKAIKIVLSNIDETLKTLQPKEDGKGLINIDVAASFFIFLMMSISLQ